MISCQEEYDAAMSAQGEAEANIAAEMDYYRYVSHLEDLLDDNKAEIDICLLDLEYFLINISNTINDDSIKNLVIKLSALYLHEDTLKQELNNLK